MYNPTAVLKKNFVYKNTVTPFQMFVNSAKNINKHDGVFNIFLDKSVFNSHDFDHARFVCLLEYLYHSDKEVHMTVILNDVSDEVVKDIFYHMTYTRGYLMVDNMVNQYVTINRSKSISINNILETTGQRENKILTLVLHHDKI